MINNPIGTKRAMEITGLSRQLLYYYLRDSERAPVHIRVGKNYFIEGDGLELWKPVMRKLGRKKKEQ